MLPWVYKALAIACELALAASETEGEDRALELQEGQFPNATRTLGYVLARRPSKDWMSVGVGRRRCRKQGKQKGQGSACHDGG